MCKIFILTEGGSVNGMGHISRCLSLYQAFEEKGYKSQLIINSEISLHDSLHGINYSSLDWIKNEKEIFSIVKDSDIIIVDSYYCPLELYFKFSTLTKTTVYIDDNIRFEYPKGILINGVMGAEGLDYPQREDLFYLLGQKYSFLRKDFWEVPPKKISHNIESIMITCGGNDLNGLSYRILKTLSDKFPKVKKSVILKNLDTPYLDFFKKNADVFTNLSATEMKDLMLNSDLAISASGQTTYELTRVGTPFIAINTADNQTFSINNFYKNGLIEPAIFWNNPELEIELLKQINILSDFNFRKKVVNKMQNTITGKGSLLVIENIIKNTYKHKQNQIKI